MSVGYKLYREARDFLPPDCTLAELAVAWIIADDARDESRRSYIDAELLAMRTRLSATAIRGALRRLASRGYEFRVSHGKGSDGREVYAARNHRPEYLVPLIAEIRVARMGVANPVGNPVDNWAEGDTRRNPS